MVPNAAQGEEAQRIMREVLSTYQKLHDIAVREETGRYHIVFKHHMSLHMMESFKYLNCKVGWCFRAEFFVGLMSKAAHACSIGTTPLELSRKVMKKWRVMLHVKLIHDIHLPS